MTKFFTFIFVMVMSIAYGQMSGILPTNYSEFAVDWICIGLILCFFLLLFTINKYSHDSNDEFNLSRQKNEVQHELFEKK